MIDYKTYEAIDNDLGIRRGDLRRDMECYRPLLNVLGRLREKFPEVYKFVINKIMFSSGVSQMINVLEYVKAGIAYVVIMANKDEFTAAHEIAHAFLGHKFLSEDLTQEDEADALAEKWGYKRMD